MEKNFQTLQVGATYRDGYGVTCFISRIGDSGEYPFETPNGDTYTALGVWWKGADPKNDLVELISPPSLPTPTYTIAPVQWKEGVLKQSNGSTLRIWYGRVAGNVAFKILEMPAGNFFALDTFHDTLDEAKAHCQFHHEAQVKKLLLPA